MNTTKSVLSIVSILIYVMIAMFALTGCVDVSDTTGGRADEFLRSLDEDAPTVPLTRIEAVYNQGTTVVEPSTPLNNLKDGLTVTAHYVNGTTKILSAATYTLSGSLSVGTSVITVMYGDQTTTFTVKVTLPDLPTAPLVGISAVYDSPELVYFSTPLDDLKSGLIVTAEYGDGTVRTLGAAEYTLSGTPMIDMTMNVTVTHEDRSVTRTAAFTVTLSTREAIATLYSPSPFGGAVIDLSLVSGANILDKVFNYINANPETYTLVLESDVEIIELFYEAGLTQSGAKLTIIGDNAVRTVSAPLLWMTINLGVSGSSNTPVQDIELTLGNNINLQSVRINVYSGLLTMEDNSKVTVQEGFDGVRTGDNGTIIMQDNAAIIGSVSVGGSLTMNDYASISASTIDGNGVDVIGSGTFVMDGNTSIYDCSRFGVSLLYGNTGIFTMQGNASVYGNDSGGVSVVGGEFIMRGNASVYENNLFGVSIGGERRGDFTMEDNSMVYGNNGNGVRVATNSKFVMNGNASVYGNTAESDGGGVYVDRSVFIMSGFASIHGNTSNGNGGGVYLDRGEFTMEGNVSIYGNTSVGDPIFSTGSGGGVYMTAGYSGTCRFTMSGGTISGLDAPSESQKNTAVRSGAALYVDGGTAEYGDGTVIIGAGAGVDLTINGRP